MGPSKASLRPRGLGLAKPSLVSLLQAADLLKSLAKIVPLPTSASTHGPSRLAPAPRPPNNSPGICRVNSQLLPAATRGVGAAGVPVGKYGSRQWFYWKSCS